MKNGHKTGKLKGLTNIYKIRWTENFKGNTVRPGQRRENYIVIHLKPTVWVCIVFILCTMGPWDLVNMKTNPWVLYV